MNGRCTHSATKNNVQRTDPIGDTTKSRVRDVPSACSYVRGSARCYVSSRNSALTREVASAFCKLLRRKASDDARTLALRSSVHASGVVRSYVRAVLTTMRTAHLFQAAAGLYKSKSGRRRPPPGMTLHLVSCVSARRAHLAFLQLPRSGRVSPGVVRMASPSDPSLATEAPGAPVTRERKLNLNLQEELPKPYLARALVAVDPSHPQGTKGHDPRGLSVLQQHAAFFDRNGDGIIYPWETFQGMRAIGCGFSVSFMSAFLINLVLSYPTQPGWLPSPLFSIHVKNIHKAKHGSDSETYDTEGRFDPSKFDAIFSKYGLTHPNALTREELMSMLKGNRNMYDFIGWVAAAGEWLLLYSVAKDNDGLLQREAIRGVFDGSLFERLQDANEKSS